MEYILYRRTKPFLLLFCGAVLGLVAVSTLRRADVDGEKLVETAVFTYEGPDGPGKEDSALEAFPKWVSVGDLLVTW